MLRQGLFEEHRVGQQSRAEGKGNEVRQVVRTWDAGLRPWGSPGGFFKMYF